MVLIPGSKLLEHWRWRRGYAAPPIGADLLLTDACNLRCDYCPRWGRRGVWHSRPDTSMMDTTALLRLVDQLAPTRPWLRLIGGEPFLHPDWPRLVRRAGELGLWCASVSNGLIVAEQAEELVRSGLRVLGISIDGPRQIHDARRGSGSYERVMDGIAEVERIKARLGRSLPQLEVLLTIHTDNYRELVPFAEQLGQETGIWKLRLQQLIWTSEQRFNQSLRLIRSVLPDAELFGEEQAYLRDGPSGIDGRLLAEQLAGLKRNRFPFLLEIYPDLPSAEQWCAFHDEDDFQRNGDSACRITERYVFIDPKGRVYPCLSIDMGNAFEEPFADIWNSHRFRSFRRLIRHQGRLPFCQRCPD